MMKKLFIVTTITLLRFSQCQSIYDPPPCQRNPFPKKLSDDDNVASSVQQIDVDPTSRSIVTWGSIGGIPDII